MAAGGKAVLVADDDPSLRMLCRINLELEGYRVVEAQSASEVSRAIETDDVGVVLLDIHLGADDGVELARKMRASRPEIAIAFFSGTAPDASAATRSFADGFLEKPFSLEALSETVRRLAPA